MKINCPHCQEVVNFEAEMHGRHEFDCPHCELLMKVEFEAAEPVPEAQAEISREKISTPRKSKSRTASKRTSVVNQKFNPAVVAVLLCLLLAGVVAFIAAKPSTEKRVKIKSEKKIPPKQVVQGDYSYEGLELDSQTLETESKKLKRRGMAIIVPSFLRRELKTLNAFVAHKKKMGLKPILVSEKDFGGGTGREAAHNIRKWLKANQKKHDLLYVLFIGDPHPTRGEVPMKLLSDPYKKTEEFTPTDFFYVDLTGTFDINKNDIYGEPEDYEKKGGMDCQWDVLVGRIPCYRKKFGGQGFASADKILQKTMDYEQEKDIRWRYNFIVTSFNSAMAKVFDENKTDYTVTLDHENHNVGSFEGRVVDNRIADNLKLLNEITPGSIRVGGHGNTTFCGGLSSGSVLTKLQNDRPSLLQLGGCAVATPESANNLTFSLLRRGSIGVYGGTRSVTGWFAWLAGKKVGPRPQLKEFGTRCYLEGCSQGYALWQSNSEICKWASGHISGTGLLINLYGDPSVRPYPYGPHAPYAIAISPNHLKSVNYKDLNVKGISLRVTNKSRKKIKIALTSNQDWLSTPDSLEIEGGKTALVKCKILKQKIIGGGNHLAQLRFSGVAGINRVRNIEVFKEGPPRQAPKGNLPPEFNRTALKIKFTQVKDMNSMADLAPALQDPEGERLSFEALNVPSWIIVNNNGLLQTPYGAPESASGVNSLKIRVSDPYKSSRVIEVKLLVPKSHDSLLTKLCYACT